MSYLQVSAPALGGTKQKALEDAKKMQLAVHDECVKAGKEPPAYLLQELIGKGSFGRVYKAKDLKASRLVAVKIIDIEESDTLNPKLADTYSEFLKEINALKLLSAGGAKNINHVLDALPVGHAMWMITEYCAGGSVSTLMKPTAPGGLKEKWIIPILREVSEAISWVHRSGIIHRDIKCANVLITEAGGVQLCDFGVAGVIETKFDKRSTVIGTPHWMAPELFDESASYGTEVDIWAFGSLVFEIASGLPPNAIDVHFAQLGTHLKHNTPRLEGGQYSEALKNLVSYCMVEAPSQRPTIEQVQRHPYIFNTSAAYPTASLENLVRGFKMWEAQGGSRKSLFAPGGAQGPTDIPSTAMAEDEWNFSTTVDFDRSVLNNSDAQAVFDVYGSNVDLAAGFNDETTRPAKTKARRRPPPQLPVMKAPLEKVFDPNTISNYEENARAYYGLAPPPPQSDLPLRDDSMHSTLRESLIDLDASLFSNELSLVSNMDTIRAGPRPSHGHGSEDTTDLDRPPLSDPAELNNNRRTQDWKFPVLPPPASADPEVSRFPGHDQRYEVTPSAGARPSLVHHATEPLSLPSQASELMVPHIPDNRASVGSLIDLDEGLADPVLPELTRPSTADSDAGSVSGSEFSTANPFDLERHASLYAPETVREPSIYISDDSDYAHLGQAPEELNRIADLSLSDDTQHSSSNYGDDSSTFETYSDYLTVRERRPGAVEQQGAAAQTQGPVPEPPSARVMSGAASREETREEFLRLLGAFHDELGNASEYINSLAPRRAGSSRQDHQPSSP